MEVEEGEQGEREGDEEGESEGDEEPDRDDLKCNLMEHAKQAPNETAPSYGIWRKNHLRMAADLVNTVDENVSARLSRTTVRAAPEWHQRVPAMGG
jgi:hypothetical protein